MLIEDGSRAAAAQLLHHALRIGAIEREKVLKNERVSPYFFNSGGFTSGRSLAMLANAYIAVMRSRNLLPDVVFGPAYKGISLAAAIVTLLGDETRYAYNRKEEKDHGEGGSLVGAPLGGKRVLIVDDVITDGVTKEESLRFVRWRNGIPVGILVGFDRQERSTDGLSANREFERKHDIPVYAASTLEDLISLLRNTPPEEDDSVHEWLHKILEYRAEYGV